MATVRKRTLKVLTLLVLFIFLTSFLLNYSHMAVATSWFPKQMVLELSENFRKLVYSHRPCTCARCVGQRRVSSWFDERFNWSMQPLLTAQNALLEESTYSWWLVRAGPTGGPGGLGPATHVAGFAVLLSHSFGNYLSRICYEYVRVEGSAGTLWSRALAVLGCTGSLPGGELDGGHSPQGFLVPPPRSLLEMSQDPHGSEIRGDDGSRSLELPQEILSEAGV